MESYLRKVAPLDNIHLFNPCLFKYATDDKE
nr:MAG TPA: hypothetical protein [Caudoviricetes sp.]